MTPSKRDYIRERIENIYSLAYALIQVKRMLDNNEPELIHPPVINSIESLALAVQHEAKELELAMGED